MLAQKTFVVATRCKLSEFGALRCPDLADKTGAVVEVSLRSIGITVLFDGGTRPTCLRQDYLSRLSG
jgi:hypothetical protein